MEGGFINSAQLEISFLKYFFLLAFDSQDFLYEN